MQHPKKLMSDWRSQPLMMAQVGMRWTRQSLAVAWQCSERKVDRIRKSGALGDPVGKVGKTELYSDEQKQAAERAGLVGQGASP